MIYSSPPHENVQLEPNDKNIETIVSDFVCDSFAGNWIESKSSLKIKKMTDGLSNALFAVRSSDFDGVMVKIYGLNSDLIVDRQAEMDLMKDLSKFAMSMPILVTFNNGFVYKYALGEPIKAGEQKKSHLIASSLAKFHSMSDVHRGQSGQIAEKLRHYINLFNGTNDKLFKRLNLPTDTFVNKTDWINITKEIDRIERVFENPQGIWSKLAVVMCHNDTQSLNFLCDKKANDQISLIDFEHGARNIWLVDVFNYFLEYGGVDSDEPDFEKNYPSRDKQKQFLQSYLNSAYFLKNRIEKQMTLDQLCDLGDCLCAPIHLYWALWAYLEALLNFQSDGKFDYVKYGTTRLNQYERLKEKFFLSVEK